MRTLLHLGVIVALLISFSRAPYDHYHPGDADHDHDHHERFSLHTPFSGPVWDEQEHDATAQVKAWLAGDGTSPAKHSVELMAVAWAQPLAMVVERAATFAPRNHDPPLARTLDARGPPDRSLL